MKPFTQKNVVGEIQMEGFFFFCMKHKKSY